MKKEIDIEAIARKLAADGVDPDEAMEQFEKSVKVCANTEKMPKKQLSFFRL